MVGEGNVGASLPGAHVALSAANVQLGDLLASRAKLQRRRERRRNFDSILRAFDSDGVVHAVVPRSFSNRRDFRDFFAVSQQTAQQ